MLNRRTTSVFSQKDISVCLLAAIGHVNTQEDEDHGEGGYGDEALAIAFYCALKHFPYPLPLLPIASFFGIKFIT